MKRRWAHIATIAAALLAAPSLGHADTPAVAIRFEAGVSALAAKRIRAELAAHRATREELALPAPGIGLEEAGAKEGLEHIQSALAKARDLASEASWTECVREAGAALGVATAVLARTGNYGLLRDLHVQMGVCLTLDGRSESAEPHFVTATLLDESEPKEGLFRKEAEDSRARVRGVVLKRERGTVRIHTLPQGAEVWIDGRKVEGATPLEVAVRTGDHFITVRRFRFEPSTEVRFLQPSADVEVTLEPARRSTLAEQLNALPPAGGPSALERAIGRAAWSRAEELIVVAPLGPSASAVRLALYDTATGERIRERKLVEPKRDDALREAVCGALGQKCVAPSSAPPWYVWPIAGAALVGTALVIGLVVESERNVRICSTTGCP